MQKYAFLLILLSSCFALQAQKVKSDIALEKRISSVEDRIAIKNLVDAFSILADQNKMQEQTLLFTENASVESISNG